MKLKIILSVFLISLTNFNATEISSSKIQNKSYTFYKENRSKEIRNNCKLDQLAAYGLFGDAESLNSKNSLCPNIKKNCCGKLDIERIKKFWYRDRKRIEYYHRTILLIYKWILGYGKQINFLAKAIAEDYQRKINPENFINEKKKNYDFGINSNFYCYKAAKEMLSLDYETEEKVESFYWAITQKIQFIENTRKNFYCILCSIEGQKSIHNSPKLYSWLYNKRIYYDDEFCNIYVERTFTVSYQKWTTFNDYISDFLKITTCLSPSKNNSKNPNPPSELKKNLPLRSLTQFEKKLFSNPLNLENGSLMAPCDEAFGNIDFDHLYIFCDFWCQSFNIAKAINIHDGDIKASYKLYKYLKPLKIYFHTEKNHFNADMVLMEKDIEQNYKKAPKNGIFFLSLSKSVDLQMFQSDFVFHGTGINPLVIGNQNGLRFEYEKEDVLRCFFGVILVWVFGV